eukprot:evm.model.scf_150EXC.12 EVM.evm.TU.scf_150EXC.12   scf_150EXC:106140-108367(+)
MRRDDYKERVARFYNEYSPRYDAGDMAGYHEAIARRLVDMAGLAPGQRVLDAATGTGMAALEAAARVGPSGAVLGVDIAEAMLDVARRKVAAQGVCNVELMLADAEAIDFPAGSFDAVLCSAAIVWMHVPAALALWRGCLSPGGVAAWHGFSEASFVKGAVGREVGARHGVVVADVLGPTGTAERCAELMEGAGYEEVRVETGEYGAWLPLEAALRWKPPTGPMVETSPPLSESEIEQMGKEYREKILDVATEAGVWDDRTVYFVTGRAAAAPQTRA